MKPKIIEELLTICLVLCFFTSQGITSNEVKFNINQNIQLATLCDGPDGVMLQ